jgi:hypothetical protein
MASKKQTRSEIMGKSAIFLKFVEIFPEYKRFCLLKKYQLGNVQKFLSTRKGKFPESIDHMKSCIICRTAGWGSKEIPLCWNCMLSIECVEYNSHDESLIEHVDYDQNDTYCFNDFGEFDRKKCIHKK